MMNASWALNGAAMAELVSTEWMSITAHVLQIFLEKAVSVSYFAGGFPDENIYNRTHGNFVRSFNGCIQHIFLGKRMDQLDITSFDGANIKECVV